MTTLFWDKNLGKAIPRAFRLLKPASVSTRFYLQEYPGSGSAAEDGDDAWLEDVGNKGWFVITQDYNLHLRESELFAIKHFGVGCFYLWGASNSKWDTFRCFALGYDRIIEASLNASRPFVYRVNRNGTLRQVDLS